MDAMIRREQHRSSKSGPGGIDRIGQHLEAGDVALKGLDGGARVWLGPVHDVVVLLVVDDNHLRPVSTEKAQRPLADLGVICL